MITDPQPSQPVKKTHAVKIIRQVVVAPPTPPTHRGFFQKLSIGITARAGAPGTFILAILVVLIWAASGPFLNFSNEWQLTINTGTTIITFLMVFAIQSTQNRDSRAMHLKMDELLKNAHGKSAEFVDIEDLDDADLDVLHEEFRELHEKFQARANKQ